MLILKSGSLVVLDSVNKGGQEPMAGHKEQVGFLVRSRRKEMQGKRRGFCCYALG